MEQIKIPCTVGILTFNSSKGIVDCLESVKDFEEIIISDGGSTDDTLEIAKRYGAKIISQTNPGHPIANFAKERQHMLDTAACDWFFYLDSDEKMLPKLRDAIREVSEKNPPEHLVYKVRYAICSADYKTEYVSYKPYYQTRLFNKKSGAYFIKKMHERIKFDSSVSVGQIEAAWLVPLHDQLDFKVYKRKVDHRLGILASEWQSKNFLTFIKKVFLDQVVQFFKQLYKTVALRVRERSKDVVPLSYDVYRLYSPLAYSFFLTKRYLGLIFKK